MPATEILVIGASFAGLTFVQKLAAKVPDAASYHITLVDPVSELVWTIALPRGLVQPDFGRSLFFPIQQALSKHPNVTHVKNYVQAVDPAAKTVRLAGGQTLPYDLLVVASGASSPVPWKVEADSATPDQRLKAYLKDAAEAIKGASTVVVGGGGPIGIETVAEIKESYPKKRVVLVHAHEHLLSAGDWPSWMGTKLEKALAGAGVELVTATKVLAPAGSSLQPTTIQLSSGSTIADAVYIAAIGFKSNSAFLPRSFVDSKGDVKVKPNLQTDADASVWALGDVINTNRKFGHVAGAQADILAANLAAVLKGAAASKQWKAGSVMGVVQLGTYGGAGVVSWFSLPSFLVRRIKGKDLLRSHAAELGFTL